MWPAIIGAGAALLGTALSNDRSTSEAEKNRDFQEELSNTAYQRAMKDMRAAGLNPILAGKLGGSSTPTGAMANIRDYGSSIAQGSQAGSTAQQTDSNVEKQETEIEQIKYSIYKIQKEVQNIEADTIVKRETAKLTEEQTAVMAKTFHKVIQETALASENTSAQQLENVQRRIIAEFYDSAELVRVAKELGINPQTLKTIYSMFFMGKKGK